MLCQVSQNAVKYSISKGVNAWWHIDYFNLVDTTLAMYWAIKLSTDFNMKNELLVKRSQDLAHLLQSIQLDSGTIPPFAIFNNKNEPEIVHVN